MFSKSLSLSLLAFSSTWRGASASLECRPEGPVVPPPRNLAKSTVFQQAAAKLGNVVERAIKGDIKAGWVVENTSFSIGVVSLGQEKPHVPLWEYHHLAAGNVNGTKKLSRDSQYLIGSISKVISDAVLMKSGLDLDHPITKYIPTLNNGSSLIDWNHVTLKALASQLSGIPPNHGFSEFYYIKEWFQKLGYPALNDTDYPPCGIIGLNKGCSKEQFLQGMLEVRPIASPNDRPVYSNIAFSIFSYAIEAATGKNYSTQLQDYLTGPLKMTSTRPSPGNDSLAVIPPMENTWGSDYADNAPGGGLVSTLSDLSTFLHSILSNTLFDGPTTRNWLKPASFAGSPYSFVGMPWEIFQPPPGSLTPAHPHTVTLYNKGGAAYGYNSRISLIPQYGVGIILLTAGDPNVSNVLNPAITSLLIPAIDEAAREQAAAPGSGVVGTFAGAHCALGNQAPGGKSTAASHGCVNIKLAMDSDSILIANLTRNDADISAAYGELWDATLGQFFAGIGKDLRIFPAGVAREGAHNGVKVVREDWRLWWPLGFDGSPRTDLPGGELLVMDCLLWPAADWLHYGKESLDRFVVVREEDSGKVIGVEVPFLRSGVLERVDGQDHDESRDCGETYDRNPTQRILA